MLISPHRLKRVFWLIREDFEGRYGVGYTDLVTQYERPEQKEFRLEGIRVKTTTEEVEVSIWVCRGLFAGFSVSSEVFFEGNIADFKVEPYNDNK